MPSKYYLFHFYLNLTIKISRLLGTITCESYNCQSKSVVDLVVILVIVYISFETLIVDQFPMKLIIIQAKYVISKSRLSQNRGFHAYLLIVLNFYYQKVVFIVGTAFLTMPQNFHVAWAARDNTQLLLVRYCQRSYTVCYCARI